VVVDKGAALPAVGHVWSRKRHGYLQLKASGAVLNGVGPQPDAVDWRFLSKLADLPAIP
jgi:hypothetical protein